MWISAEMSRRNDGPIPTQFRANISPKFTQLWLRNRGTLVGSIWIDTWRYVIWQYCRANPKGSICLLFKWAATAFRFCRADHHSCRDVFWLGGGPRVVVSTAAFHARVRGSVPGLGGLKETKMFLPHPRVKVSIVGSLRDREVACSASDLQGSNFESCVWRTVSSQSSHHPQEVLLAQFSLYVHKGGLKPDSFHFCLLIAFLFACPAPPRESGCYAASGWLRHRMWQYKLDGHSPKENWSRNPTETQGIDTMLGHCWPTVFDAGPTMTQHCVNALCLMGCAVWLRIHLHGEIGGNLTCNLVFFPHFFHGAVNNGVGCSCFIYIV